MLVFGGVTWPFPSGNISRFVSNKNPKSTPRFKSCKSVIIKRNKLYLELIKKKTSDFFCKHEQPRNFDVSEFCVLFFPSQNSCEKHPCHDGFHLSEDSTGTRQVFQKAGTFGAPGGHSRRTKICPVKGEMIYIYISMAHHATRVTTVGKLRVC